MKKRKCKKTKQEKKKQTDNNYKELIFKERSNSAEIGLAD